MLIMHLEKGSPSNKKSWHIFYFLFFMTEYWAIFNWKIARSLRVRSRKVIFSHCGEENNTSPSFLPESFLLFLSSSTLSPPVLFSCFIGANMEVAAAGWFVGPIVTGVISAGFHRLKYQFRWKKHMKELERLQFILPKIQAVVALASSQTEISDQHLYKWLWQLRDAIDEADDVLDDFEYMKFEKQLAKNKKQTKVRSIMKSIKKRSVKIGLRALKIDPNLKRLKEALQKLDKVSAGANTFIQLVKDAKREQQEELEELYKARGTGPMTKNDQVGRAKEKEFILQWLKKPSNDLVGSTLQSNISLLSIVGVGGMGKTTLLQDVYEDETTEEFDLKMWVCVSNNFDEKRVIADMLECLKKERPRLETLEVLQKSLKSAVTSKKFLLVLDDIWEEEERNKCKWENVLTPLISGKLGSKILVTTRMDSTASLIAKVIKKKRETLRLEGLEEAACLHLLNNHAFAGVENPGDHRKLRSIAGELVKKLSGSPLAAKVMGGVLNSSLDESHWIKLLNSDFSNAESSQIDIMLIFRLSYNFLPKLLQSCFTFCCMFPEDHNFDKDDLIRMWIALGFVQPSFNQEETLEDIGGRYLDVLVQKSFFDKLNTEAYKMHDLLHELAQSVSARECFRVECDGELLFKIPETIRHLSIKTNNLEVLKNIGKFKKLRSLFLTYKDNQALLYEDDQGLVEELAKIFEAVSSIRILYIYAQGLKMIPDAIGRLKHLRYLKIDQTNIVQLPKSLSKLYHLQSLIYDTDFWHVSRDILPSNILPSNVILVG